MTTYTANTWNTGDIITKTKMDRLEAAVADVSRELPGTSVVANGADPTGSADSTTAFQNTINAGDVLIPAGTYKVGKITYAASSSSAANSRRIVALGPVTIIQTATGGVFDLRGGWDTIGNISSYTTTTGVYLVPTGEPTPASAQSAVTTLTMSSAVSLTSGDIVKIVSDDQIVSAPGATSRRGEYSVIPKTVSSSTSVPLSNVLIETYTTSPRLARLWPIRFEISGPITFDTDSSLVDMTASEPVVYLKAAVNCYVGNGVEFRNHPGRALSNFAYATHVDGVRFRNLANRPTYQQYGYGVEDCGWQTRMTGCVGENLRHLYTDNDGDTTAGSTLFENFGGGWFAHVSNCVAFGTAASSFDTHGTSYGTVFANCRAYGTYNGADTGGTGFSSRGRKITFINCVADQCYRGFVARADDTTLINCRAQKTLAGALEVGKDTGSSIATVKATITGGLYESVGTDEYFAAYLGSTGTTINVDINGARFRKLTAPTNGLRMIELAPNVNLKFTDLTIDWESYVRSSGDELISFWLTGASISVLGWRLYHLGGSSAAGSFTGFKASTSAANTTPIEVYGIDHRHSSVAMTVVDSPLTAARTSWRQNYGAAWFQNTGSNDLVLTAATGAVLPIADKADSAVSVRLTGSNGAVTLAALPTTGLIPGQMVTVANDSNGAVAISGQSAIPVGSTATYAFVQGSWWALTSGTGGGGTTTPRAAVARRTAGNLSLGNTSWTSVDTAMDLTLAAAAGDWLEVSLSGLITDENANRLYMDAVTLVSGAAVNAVSGQSVSASRYGVPGWSMSSAYKGPLGGTVLYQVQAGDVSGGNVTLRLQYANDNTTARTLSATTGASGWPLIFGAKIVH